MRILLDTNVLVSGLLSRSESPPGRLIDLWLDGEFTLVTSQFQADELGRVFSYGKIRRRLSAAHAEDFLTNFRAMIPAEPVDLPDVTVSADPDDNRILATAIAMHADLVVTGDKRDLLALRSVKDIPILSPVEALRVINEARR